MTCEECPLRERCYERRGICLDCIRYMERIERTRKQIEQLNNENQAPPSVRTVPANKGGIQEAGDRRGKVYQGTPKRVQAEARTYTEAQTEDQGIPEAAEVEGNGQA